MTQEAGSATQSDLFFESLVNSYVTNNPRFLRRDWLVEEVEARMADVHCRFVLLTAEPGAGKTAFMAQLAADHPPAAGQPAWLRYFIRRDQRTPLGDVDAKSFLLRIGYQLAALHPELFTRERVVALSVEQRIGEVEAEGEVVGAKVERVLASPFYQKTLEIRQHVERNAGRIVGLKLEELVIEKRQLDASDLQSMALLDPARALLERDPSAQIVVLVDALDEIRYHDAEDNVLRWLTNCPELPPNVRFVLSSRPPDDALKVFCQKQAPYMRPLAITPEDDRVRADVKTYTQRLASRPEVADDLPRLSRSADAFVAEVAAKANGNLGYLAAIERAVDAALARPGGADMTMVRALFELRELPDELEGLYAFFLRQIKAQVARERVELTDPETGETYDKAVWPAIYSRILGVLAVALAPLQLDQILALGGIKVDRECVVEAMNRLAQFRDIGSDGFRLYHATVPEFLTSCATRKNAQTTDLWVDAKRWHRQVADYYWHAYHDDWLHCDAYGLKNLAVHLLESSDERLHRLITKDWLNARYVADGYTYGGFLDDVDYAWQAALAQGDAKHICPLLVRLQAAQQLVDQEVDIYSDDDLSILVWLGRANEAIAHARLRNNSLTRFRGLLAIFGRLQPGQLQFDWRCELWACARTINGEWDQQKALQATLDLALKLGEYDYALQIARSGEMKWGQSVSALIDIANAMVNVEDERACAVFGEALALERSSMEKQPGTLSRIGYGFWQLKDDRAHEVFDEALAAILPISDMGRRCVEAGRVGIILARTGDERAELAFTSARADASSYSETADDIGFQVHLLAQLAVALSQSSNRRAEDVFAEALVLARSVKAELPLIDYATRLGEIAAAFVQVGNLRSALEIARTIDHEWQQAEALMGIAAAVQTEDEHAILDDMRTVANAIESEHYRAKAVSRIAIAMARIGDGDQALNLAHSITSRMHKSDALIEIAAILDNGGDPRASAVFDEAKQEVSTIEPFYPRKEASIKLARALAQADNWEAARTVVTTSQLPTRHRVQALREVASVLARKRHPQAAAILDEALAAARAIGFWHSTLVLCNMAGVLAQKGDSQASMLLTKALDVARELRSPAERARFLTYVGAFMSQTGDKQADTVFGEALACAQHLGPEDPDYFQDTIVCNVASVLARAGEYDRALALIDGMQPALFGGEVLSGLQSKLREGFKSVLSVALACAGYFDDALDIARELEAGELSVGARRRKNLMEDPQDGLLLMDLLEVAEPLELPWGRIEVLAEIATALSQTGDAQAHDVFAEALRDAQALGDPVRRAKVLSLKAGCLARTGDTSAMAILDEALAVARTIEFKDNVYQAAIFGEIAATMAVTGNVEQALKLGLAISDDSDKVIQAEALSRIAGSLAELGRFEEALGLVRPFGQDWFLMSVSRWSSAFEKVASGLSLTVLQEATDVVGWLSPEWHKIHELLVASTPEE